MVLIHRFQAFLGHSVQIGVIELALQQLLNVWIEVAEFQSCENSSENSSAGEIAVEEDRAHLSLKRTLRSLKERWLSYCLQHEYA